MNANLTFSGVPLAYRSRSLGEGSSQTRGTDVSEVDLGSVTRLHLAVAELFNAVSSALQKQWDTAQESVQRASAILKVEPPFSCAPISAKQNGSAIRIRGGLAPWQIRRVTTHVETNLGAAITTKDLATLARLSSFHFCRAFRDSLGESPHSYVMRRRV